jgi:hypothetical protein
MFMPTHCRKMKGNIFSEESFQASFFAGNCCRNGCQDCRILILSEIEKEILCVLHIIDKPFRHDRDPSKNVVSIFFLKGPIYFYSRPCQPINNPTKSNCDLISVTRLVKSPTAVGTSFANSKVNN